MASIRALKIISGGQTGVDQIGLQVAKSYNIETGGWMPKGWLTVAGPRPEFAQLYGMRECPVEGYPARTAMNARDSHLTIWFGDDSRGMRATRRSCDQFGRMFQDSPKSWEGSLRWLRRQARLIDPDEGPMVLNYAGTRYPDAPAAADARRFLIGFIEWYLLWT